MAWAHTSEVLLFVVCITFLLPEGSSTGCDVSVWEQICSSVPNRAADFDGSGNSSVALPIVTLGARWSVSAWLYVREQQQNTDPVEILSLGTGSRGYLLSRNRSSLILQMIANWSVPTALTFQQLPEGEWLHITVVQDGGSFVAYLNGDDPLVVQASTTTSNDTYVFSQNQLGAAWSGKIDNVKVWDRALQRNEITAAMRTVGPTNGLLANWGFDEEGGTFVEDLSGNRRHAVMNSTAKRVTDTECQLYAQPVGCENVTACTLSPNRVAQFPGRGFFQHSHVTLPDVTLESNWSAAVWLFADRTVGTDWADILNLGRPGHRWYLIRRTRGKLTIEMSNNGNKSTLTFHQVPTDEWLHFTIVQSVALVTVYLNGSDPLTRRDENKTMAPYDDEYTFAPSQVGAAYHTDSTWKGRMDNVKIWGRSLEQGEVGQAMRTNGPSVGLLGYWRFDAGVGSVVQDFSGNRRNATMESAVNRTVEANCVLYQWPACPPGQGGADCAVCGRGTWASGGTVEPCIDCSESTTLRSREEFVNKAGLMRPEECTTICSEGYHREDEDDDTSDCVDVDECETGAHFCDVKVGNCVNFPGGVTCSCNTGYQQQLTEDSHRCLDVDECEGRRGVNYFCQSYSICNNTVGSYECVCNAGFTATSPRACNDVDECEEGVHTCHENNSCSNSFGSFQCRCLNGFEEVDDKCVDIDECALGRGNDGHQCDINAVCNNIAGGYECSCNSGFVQRSGDCNDLDECSVANHTFCADEDNATCSNSFGSFECACDAGFARLQEAVDESCDADWTEWEGSCFRPLFRENDNDRAESLCSDLGAHLPVVTSRAESDFLFNLNGQEQFWLGIRKNEGETSGSIAAFTWVDGSEGVEVDDVTMELNSAAQRCMTVGNRAVWRDNLCSSNQYVICEKQLGASNDSEPMPRIPCVNVDECVNGADNCDAQASCEDTVGSFTCSCNAGFEGNGVACFACSNPRTSACRIRMTFLATLGLSEVEFYTVRERYIRSVARAADVGPSAVETGEVTQTEVRRRRLLAEAVIVPTSITADATRASDLSANLAQNLQRELAASERRIPLLSVSEPTLEDATLEDATPDPPPETGRDLEPTGPESDSSNLGMIAWGVAAGVCVCALVGFFGYVRGQVGAERKKLEDWGL